MTVHVLMPVFNRLSMTQRIIADLAAQQADEPLSLVVIDDGSSDGTSDWLRNRGDVRVLVGDGSLWWGGAIDLGLRNVLEDAAENDWILLVNNDTHIKPDFVQTLLETARSHDPAAVGSVIRDFAAPHHLLSIGPRINPTRMRVSDAIDLPALVHQAEAGEPVEVDALSGRGVLFPVAAMRAVRGMRSKWLPHYLADYELAIRVKSAGWRLLVAPAAVTYSAPEYGNAVRGRTLREHLFAVRSPAYLPAQLRFWWEASNSWHRLTLPGRVLALVLYRTLRKKT